MPKRSTQQGFTLIELLVSLTLLALIVSSAAPLVQLSAQRNKEQELKRALWQIRDAIDAYKQAVDDGRIELSDDVSGYPQSLQILVDGVEDAQDPEHKKIYFLRRIPRDPFASDPSLSNAETWGLRSYESSFDDNSAGEDVYDVYSLSNGMGINQQPYKEW
ncbi:MAG: general secretion pathway protein GspG [Methylophaga sp.]|uniref:type II secretion system protein n=1 Tax=Methylophaga sp. UBA678 TaxID=1946901 RepID=UPI000C37EC55|nr:type II secretion system protein [Methylophaga sp. UBA678]MAX50831.1 general secretion pathway protein GspG [Methylophaga sp.]|tara:strand:- start:16484 stop:16966 length:483 start_codon:yes stop_codon:yes gene_type:complete